MNFVPRKSMMLKKYRLCHWKYSNQSELLKREFLHLKIDFEISKFPSNIRNIYKSWSVLIVPVLVAVLCLHLNPSSFLEVFLCFLSSESIFIYVCHKTHKLVCVLTYMFNINVFNIYYKHCSILGAVEDRAFDQNMMPEIAMSGKIVQD